MHNGDGDGFAEVHGSKDRVGKPARDAEAQAANEEQGVGEVEGVVGSQADGGAEGEEEDGEGAKGCEADL